jgi:ligand-binding sensor domain-containing protein
VIADKTKKYVDSDGNLWLSKLDNIFRNADGEWLKFTRLYQSAADVA